MPDLCSAGDQSQDWMHVGQALYHASYLPSLSQVSLHIWSCPFSVLILCWPFSHVTQWDRQFIMPQIPILWWPYLVISYMLLHANLTHTLQLKWFEFTGSGFSWSGTQLSPSSMPSSRFQNAAINKSDTVRLWFGCLDDKGSASNPLWTLVECISCDLVKHVASNCNRGATCSPRSHLYSSPNKQGSPQVLQLGR